MQKVVVFGHQPATQAVAAQLIRSAQPLQVAIYEPDPLVIDLDGLTALSQINRNSFVRGNLKALAGADVLVLTDYAQVTEADYLDQSLDAMRKVINEAMANGFAGKMLIATHDDAVLTYFAQRFSGLPKASVFGVGTYGLSIQLQQAIAEQLSVPQDVVTSYVVGTRTDFVAGWSRAYVASIPLLSLLNLRDMANTFLSQATDQLMTFSQQSPMFVMPQLVERVLLATSGDKPLFAPLTQLIGDSDIAYAGPVLLNEAGISSVAAIKGSEAEESALSEILTALQLQVRQIETKES